MRTSNRISCVLCHRSKETEVTGALLTKDGVTAHHKCLLYSSGIFCRESPQFDDLFGFMVQDVREEVKRGNKLKCSRCGKKGATVGCEVKRCKKSYHYPCAVQDGAQIMENTDKGNYGLFCLLHHKKEAERSTSEPGCASSHTKPTTSRDAGEADPSKTAGNKSLEPLASSNAVRLYREKRTGRSHKRNNGDSTAASSDSNSFGRMTALRSKKRLSFSDNGHNAGSLSSVDPPSKRKYEYLNGMMTEDSSDSDGTRPDMDIAMFAPIESDLEGSAPECHLTRSRSPSPAGRPSENQLEKESREEEEEECETRSLASFASCQDGESESLLPPVRSSATRHPNVVLVDVSTEMIKREGSSPEQSPDQPTTGPPCPPNRPKSRSAVAPDPPEAGRSPAAAPSDPDRGVDSDSFWKRCNAAGCTQAIFADFIKEMKDISDRIQADRASREDHDLALTVMEASGKLAEFVTKQQKELQRKRVELQKAAAAMEDVVSAVRR